MLHIIKTVFYILCIFVLLQHKAVFFRNDLNNRLSLLFRAGAGAGAGPAPPIGATAQSFLTPSESQGSLGGWTSPARRCLVSMPLYATYSSTHYRLISFGSLMMRGGWPFFSVTQRGLVSSHSGGGASTDFFFWSFLDPNRSDQPLLSQSGSATMYNLSILICCLCCW